MKVLPETEHGPSEPPWWVFAMHLAYLAVLAGLAVGYANSPTLRRLVHDPAGPLPLGVPWWGALGGVTIGLTGVFRHARDWQPGFERWHVARPFLGAIVGSVGCLIFVVVLRASGTESPARSNGGAVFDLVAFLVGYREEIFRELIKRATDSLFRRSTNTAPDTPENGGK